MPASTLRLCSPSVGAAVMSGRAPSKRTRLRSPITLPSVGCETAHNGSGITHLRVLEHFCGVVHGSKRYIGCLQQGHPLHPGPRDVDIAENFSELKVIFNAALAVAKLLHALQVRPADGGNETCPEFFVARQVHGEQFSIVALKGECLRRGGARQRLGGHAVLRLRGDVIRHDRNPAAG